MRKFLIVSAIVLPAILLCVPTASAGDEAVYAKLTSQKAVSVVSVKLVLAVKMTGAGGSQEQEMNTTSTGIIVDASGLILLPDAAFDAVSMMGIPRRFRSQVNVTSSPISIRVTFPGDTKEYDAVLGAKDSKLGLGFVLIKDLAGKVIQSVDFGATVEPRLGQELYGVTRLDQGFDHAPLCTSMRVAGEVTKPRAMWILEGADDNLAEPAYDMDGAVAGIVVEQAGVGEDAESRTFLLPLKVATATIAGALKKSKEELERILEEEDAAKATAAAAAAGEKKDPAPEEKEGEKEGEKEDDGKADEDGDK